MLFFFFYCVVTPLKRLITDMIVLAYSYFLTPECNLQTLVSISLPLYISLLSGACFRFSLLFLFLFILLFDCDTPLSLQVLLRFCSFDVTLFLFSSVVMFLGHAFLVLSHLLLIRVCLIFRLSGGF